MKEARYFLVVRFSVEPQAEAPLLRWLDGGHVKEVLSQEGFLWCRRLGSARMSFPCSMASSRAPPSKPTKATKN